MAIRQINRKRTHAATKVKVTKTKTKKKATKKGIIKADPIEAILAKMAEMDQIGVTEVKEDELLRATGYARHDSKGYRNAAKEAIKVLGYVSRETKDKVTKYTLTDKGRQHLIDIGVLAVQAEPTSNKELQAQLKGILLKSVKAPESKTKAIFDKLQDGKWHTVDALLAASEYGRTDSNGYRNIMSAMKKLDLLEKSADKVRFSDSVFKFGRP